MLIFVKYGFCSFRMSRKIAIFLKFSFYEVTLQDSMIKIYCSRPLAIDSAHVKCNVSTFLLRGNSRYCGYPWTPSGYPRDWVLLSLLVPWTRNSGSVLHWNFCNSFFFSEDLAVVRIIGVSAIRALTVLIVFPPFPKCYFNSIYTGRPSSNWRRADIWGAGGFKNYCTSKGREWNQSGRIMV